MSESERSNRLKSKWWVHFDIVAKGKVSCKLCQSVISVSGGGTTNLKNHLKHKHFVEYFALNNSQPSNDGTVEDNLDDFDGDVECVTLLSPRGATPSPSPSPSPSPTPGGRGQNSNSNSQSHVMSPPPSPSPSPSPTPGSSSGMSSSVVASRRRQATLTDFKVPDTKTTERLNMAVAYFISTCNLPLSLVEKQGFNILCQTFRPGYKPPGRKSITYNYMQKLYSTTREGMKGMLRDAQWVALTSDTWTSKAQEPYISLTAHFISKDWVLYSFALCCRSFPEDHTGVNIKEWYIEALKEWDIPQSKVTSFTTDNGDNVRLAVDLMKVTSMRCFGHTVQNGVTVVQSMKEVQELKTASHRLQQFFSTTKVKNRYKAFLKKTHDLEARSLPRPVGTRWWSELPLLRVIKEDEEHLRGFLAHYDSGKHLQLRLSGEHVITLRVVLATLEPIEELCTALCGDKYVTASAVLPVLYLIEKMANNAVEFDFITHILDHDQLNEEMQPDKTMLHHIIKKLYKRYSPPAADEMNRPRMESMRQCDVDGQKAAHKLLVKCSYLDNRFRGDLKPMDVQLAKEQLLAEVDVDVANAGEGDASSSSASASANPQPPLKKKKGMASLFARLSGVPQEGANFNLEDASQRDLLLREMGRYEGLNVPKDEAILPWWKVHQSTFPLLSELARKYLSVPASSTESERLFSQAGLVVTNLRTCLTGEHAEQLIFLSMNKDFVPKP